MGTSRFGGKPDPFALRAWLNWWWQAKEKKDFYKGGSVDGKREKRNLTTPGFSRVKKNGERFSSKSGSSP